MSELRPRSNRSRRIDNIARHGQLPQSRPWLTALKALAFSLAVVLVSGVSVAAIALNNINQSIDRVELASEDSSKPLPKIGDFEGGFNVLVVGSDTREGQGAQFGKTDSELNDVTMLLHVSQDQTSAVAVSFPRDLVVPIPSCPHEDGDGNYKAMSAQPINVTLSYGGLACTVLTVEKLTGLEIPYAGLITFDGVAHMSTAVGGVPVCVDGPINDRYTGLNLPEAGTYNLVGYEALAFLRSRHGVGDGSDLGRISSQQVYLSSLVRTLQSGGTLSDPSKLYNIAVAATENMQLSNSLANLDTMVSMANVLRKLDLSKVTFVQYPGSTGQGGVYEGKVAPIKAQATKLFDKIRADEPFLLAEGNTGVGSTVDPNAPVEAAPAPPPAPAPSETAAPTDGAEPTDGASPTPTETAAAPEVLGNVKGQTAADYTCAAAN
ncbi:MULTISPECIES: LCP family protein [unclassified Diaminobutyricimonas]|uniref:LCP family protein n=1 Tax=unclassified Diaminobutyricimonas TaxID=2643261 RepID=UPI0012F4FB22|nr:MULTISPECIES: LCP family protein [unclassified Diaminobutyricimonas]